MPSIHGCQISQTQIDLLTEPVLAIVTEACLAGAETPSYRVIIYTLRDQGIHARFAEITAIFYLLVDTGRLQREGRIHEVVYILPTGERTVPAPRGQNEKVSHEPRQIMSEEEWRERFRDPVTGQIQRYEDHPNLRPGPIDWQLSARGQSHGAAGLGASSMHWG